MVTFVTMVTWETVDFGASLQDLVGQTLRGGQHVGVMLPDQILDKLLKLLPVHLVQSLWKREKLHIYAK